MTAPNGDSDRVAEIRQRLEAALAEWRIPFVPGGQRFAHHALTAAPDDIAWLLSRLAVVEAERDELRAKVAGARKWHDGSGCDGLCATCGYAWPCGTSRALSGTTEGPS